VSVAFGIWHANIMHPLVTGACLDPQYISHYVINGMILSTTGY